MIPAEVASGVVIVSFAVFMTAAQITRRRAIARRGASIRRTYGVGDAATYFFWVPYLVVWLRPGLSVTLPDGVVWIGLALTVGGIAVALWAMATLGRHYDLTLELHGGHELVRRGPYSLVRHPIYTGLAIHSIGACLVTGNLVFIAGTAAVTFPIFVIRARAEERLLRERFGGEYERYAAEVPMLVPGLRGRGRPREEPRRHG